MQTIIKAEEGRYVKTFLSNILMNVFNINYLRELVTFVYQQKLPREKIASLVPLVIETMANGDLVAKQIIEEGCDELFLMIKIIVKELNYQKKKLQLKEDCLIILHFMIFFLISLKK